MRRLFAFVLVLLVLAFGTLADDSAADAFSGHWKGTIGTKTGSGPFEMTLTKRGNTWNGEATMGGLDGNMHPGPLKDIQIAGESLRCTFEPASDMSAVLSGKLHDGKLSGTFDGFNNGQKVTEGTWEVTREKRPNGKDAPGSKQ